MKKNRKTKTKKTQNKKQKRKTHKKQQQQQQQNKGKENMDALCVYMMSLKCHSKVPYQIEGISRYI